MNITVIGTGYVGLVAGACFAETGNNVICIDKDREKIRGLEKGKIPIYEPGLEEIVKRNIKERRIHFSTDLLEGINKGDVIFIAVGTPCGKNGAANLKPFFEVINAIGRTITTPKIIVNKSTVPVGTANRVEAILRKLTSVDFSIVSNPEFLKEGAALDDFMAPDRVVIGAKDKNAIDVMKELYAPFVRNNNPILIMDNASAEMTKYAANTMLAARITLMNEIAVVCKEIGADIELVRQGVGTDSRIGMGFLFPGIGYGGSCFPKDVQALIHTAKELGVEATMAGAIEKVNGRQKLFLVNSICEHFGSGRLKGKTFAIWGLSFKPKTDDVREAPSLVICEQLLKRGARLKAYDPEAVETFKAAFGKSSKIEFVTKSYEALPGADALVICTEWNEFRRPNFEKMKKLMVAPLIFDGRNLYDLDKMKDYGFIYHSIGRPTVGR